MIRLLLNIYCLSYGRLKKEYNGILSSDSELKNKDNSDLQKLYNTIEELCSMAKRE